MKKLGYVFLLSSLMGSVAFGAGYTARMWVGCMANYSCPGYKGYWCSCVKSTSGLGVEKLITPFTRPSAEVDRQVCKLLVYKAKGEVMRSCFNKGGVYQAQ